MVNRAQLSQLLGKTKIGVLSTVGTEGQPQSAVTDFTVTPDLEFIIGTSSDSRKAANLAHNHQASYVLGWDDRITLQMDGEARILAAQEFEPYRQVIQDKNPASAVYLDKPGQVYILFTPTWMRYTDARSWPWAIQEEIIETNKK